MMQLKYVSECPCGIRSSACAYHRDLMIDDNNKPKAIWTFCPPDVGGIFLEKYLASINGIRCDIRSSPNRVWYVYLNNTLAFWHHTSRDDAMKAAEQLAEAHDRNYT